ncbi:aminopeptidase N [Polymorphobacter fuscus]|uniref:Aminopeptidase N n=1 Tax=Sandarakinorhabdus fusca TaxID=1439888 RepID=A0A7C9GQH1_9SPHN|nr:aminopeptidase N [Polymorphobacter fuscus]KAB7646602.1 aminopeptidase N [Polymorphobacter fuscus]MQT17590.1 aminopeptidase N [Polymorphobacter fuscus]
MLDARTVLQMNEVRLSDYRPPDWLVPTVALDVRLDVDRTLVTSRLTVTRNGDHRRPLRLDGQDLETRRILVDGAPVEAVPNGEELVLAIPGDSAVVEIEVAIAPRTNTRLMGLYGSDDLLVTQCEAEGFRRITWFPDRPDVLSLYTVRLEGDAAQFPILLSNGDRGAAETLDGGRHAVTWTDPWPKPSYLFAMVGGQLAALRDEFVTMNGRRVELAIWTAAADVGRCSHAMAALKASMDWDERIYGREYDLDQFNIVAVSDFNAGAMENKGLNVFNSKYILADSETATDADFDAVAGVVAHEYFHNWTGNRVTCRDWFQLSLKEGLTVFRDQQFSADQGSAAVRRIDDVRALRAVQFPEDAGPHAHPIRPDHYVEIGNFYTATVYNKGAEVIRMLHTLLGRDGFRRGTDLYFERHDGQAVTCEDWVAAMEAATGRNLTQFRRWYDQAGTPTVTVHMARAGRQLTVNLAQSLAATPGQPSKAMMHMPFRLALIGRDSGRRIGDERLVELTAGETRLVFEDLDEPVLLSLNRGFSAPVKVVAPASRADLAFLAGADDDPFARWEAMQRLSLDVLATDDDPHELVDAIAATLADGAAGRLDPAFVGEAVLLPTEAFIGDQASVVDVESIHRRREAARAAIAAVLEPQWWQAWHWHSGTGTALNAGAKGARRLANVALAYLVTAGSAEALAAARQQYDGAATMTDRIGALSALINTDTPERDACLADFYDRFAGNGDVIDKWFTVQALSTRADTLEQVQVLLRHKDFTLHNPNRLRALVGAFAANQRRFHAADGSGYRLLADQLLAVDRINPQSAARLAVPLGRWQRFDAGRGALMQAQLQRIAGTAGVSKDVMEMATRALA